MTLTSENPWLKLMRNRPFALETCPYDPGSPPFEFPTWLILGTLLMSKFSILFRKPRTKILFFSGSSSPNMPCHQPDCHAHINEIKVPGTVIRPPWSTASTCPAEDCQKTLNRRKRYKFYDFAPFSERLPYSAPYPLLDESGTYTAITVIHTQIWT